jgi:hypothetical protein
MKTSYTFLVWILLICFFTGLLGMHLIKGIVEPMTDALTSTKNLMANNINISADLGGRVSALGEQQPPAPQAGPHVVVGMDSVISSVYQPIQVTCTIQDCDAADDLKKQGYNLASNNYFNDGFRECDSNVCSKIRELNKTMTPLDPSGGHFRDDKGNIYDFKGNLVNT